MRPHREALSAISRPLTFLCGTALIATSALLSIEVVLRRFLNVSMAGADEISGYVLAGVSAWGFAHTAIVKAHIRIDTLIRLVGQPYRALLDLVAQASLLVFAATLSYHAWLVLSFSITRASRSQTPLRVPLWIPQSIWTGGLFFFTLVCSGMLLFACARLARRDWSGASELLSADEVKDEVALAQKTGETASGAGP